MPTLEVLAQCSADDIRIKIDRIVRLLFFAEVYVLPKRRKLNHDVYNTRYSI